MSFTTFATRDAMIAAAADTMAEALRQGVEAHGAACAALSGGSAEHVYRALATAPLDWAKISFALVDERFVPPTHEASNQNMLERALAPAFAAGARLQPLYVEAPDAATAAAAVDASYAALSFDIALMGMGEDGHTASWFADADGLTEAFDLNGSRSVVAITAPQARGAAQRLTLTRAALRRARRLMLVITSDKKRAVFESAAASGAPVAALLVPDLAPLETLWAA